MRSVIKATRAAVILAAMAAILVACEDGGVLPPTGSTLEVFADPQTVTIDLELNEDQAQSTIIARIVDESGFPAQGVDVGFTTNAGTLERSSAGSSLKHGTCR